MSFASKVLYTGDGVTTDFTVTMPYIDQTHISVFVNEIFQLRTFSYNWNGTSTIKFVDAPGIDDAIEIKRWTSPTQILVDFENGSVLNESDLDTAYLHNYYLSQEYADSFNEVINEHLVNVATSQGIESTDPDEVVLDLVASMLEHENSTNLQARITDIDNNAEAIMTLGESLQVQINTLAAGVASAVWIQPEAPVPGVGGVPNPIPEGSRWYDSDDNNHPYIYQSSAWYDIDDPRIGNNAADIAILYTNTGDNNALVLAETTARTNADTAIATDLALVGAANAGGTAFIIDLNTAYVGASESLGSRFATITSDWGAGDTAVSAEVSAEAVTRASEDAVVAGTVTSLTTVVDGNTSSVSTLQGSVNGIEAEYGVTLNVNNYVTGFKLINQGVGSDAFVILASKFAVVDASGDPGETEYVPFEISGGKINLRGDVKVDGDLLVTGTVNGSSLINGTIGSTQIGSDSIYSTHIGANQVTATEIATSQITATHINGTQLDVLAANTGTLYVDESLTMSAAGHMKGGQTAYNTGDGFWIGYTGGDYKFSIGNGTSQGLWWDGSTLTIRGDLEVGEYTSSDDIILTAATERSDSGPYGGWQTYKTFTIDKSGTVKLTVDYKHGTFSGGVVTGCQWQVTVNSIQDTYWSSSIQTSYTTRTVTLSGLSAGDVIDINMIGGERNPSEPLPVLAYVKNAYIKADVVISPGGTVDLD